MPSRKSNRPAKGNSQTIVLSSEEDEYVKNAKATIALSVLREANGMHSVEVVAAANKRLLAYLA